ncbi:MAG: universal stress protein [Pseudomonadota bacterium]
MSYRTILVNLNETANIEAILASAAGLATEFEAQLTGLYVIPAVRIYPSAVYEPIPDMFEAHREYFDRREAKIRAAFSKALSAAGIGNDLRIERSASPLICDAVIDRGRACDLVMVSQTESMSKAGVELDFVPRVLVAAGRPVIVVPFDLPMQPASATVVIGWNGSREAARAAFDSLPILRRAREVYIIRVDPPSDPGPDSSLAGEDIAASLRRHGVNALLSPLITRGQDAGEALLDKAKELGAGLLVIGAYGHSRLHELVLGGVTRTVLRKMTCPVLLSH